MGESGPVSWDRSDKVAGAKAAAHFDPLAFEERLKVARAQRAEALARRRSDTRPSPVPRPQRAAPFSPPESVEHAPRLRPAAVAAQTAAVTSGPTCAGAEPNPLPTATPVPAAASKAPEARDATVPRAAERIRSVAAPRLLALFAAAARAPRDGRRLAYPLATALALALAGALVLPRGPGDDPVAPPAVVTAQPPAPAVPAARRPSAVERTVLPADLRNAAPEARAPVIQAAAPAAPPPAPLPEAARTLPAPAPPPAAAEPPAAPPPASRVLVNVPTGLPADGVETALAALRARGVPEVLGQPTDLTIGASTVRYYHPEDAGAAAEIAAIVAPHLPGGRAEPRDFTSAPSRAAPGNLEIWVAGDPAPGEARAPAGVPIRRLVETALSGTAPPDRP